MARKKKAEVKDESELELEAPSLEQDLDLGGSEDGVLKEAQESFEESVTIKKTEAGEMISHKKFHKFEKRGF